MLQELEYAADPARLQKCLEEIAHLSRGDVTHEQYFRRFMGLAVPAMRVRGIAIFFPGVQEYQCAGATNLDEIDFAADPRQRAAILAAAREAGEGRQPVIVGSGNAEGVQPAGRLLNFKPFPFIHVPAMWTEPGGEVVTHAVITVWLPTGADPRRFQELVTFQQSIAREAASFLRAKRVETLAAGNARLQKMIAFVTEMAGQYEIKRLGTVLVNWAREITGCERCAFFAALPSGRLFAVAVSNVEVVNPKSALVRLQCQLAQEAMDALEPTLFQKSAPNRKMQGDISDYFVLSHATDALAVPLFHGDGEKLGVLLVESHHDKPLEKETQNLASAVAARAIKPVAAALEVNRLPLLRVMRKLAEIRRRAIATGPRALLFRYGLPMLVLLMVACYPMRLTIRADCKITPKVHGIAVAEVGGRVKQVFVKEGESVAPGQPLAKVDDSDLQQTLRLTQEEMQRYEIESNRAEAAGDQASRQIAAVEASRCARQIEVLRTQIDRTTIRATIPGVVLTKDVDNLTGALFGVGTKFCEIGDFQRWQVVNQIPESEVGLLETRLRDGPLKMTFVLNSGPGREIDATIPGEQAISPISMAVPGANIFLVRAEFQETPELLSGLKFGYSGRCKIQLDRRPALYLGLRKFINYMRVRWFF